MVWSRKMQTLRGCLALGGKPHFGQKQCCDSSLISWPPCCFVLINDVTIFDSWHWCLFSVTHTCTSSNIKFINQLVSNILSWEYHSRWEVKTKLLSLHWMFHSYTYPRRLQSSFSHFFFLFLLENFIFLLMASAYCHHNVTRTVQ